MDRYLFVSVTILELTVRFTGAVVYVNISAAVGQESVVLPCVVLRDRQVDSVEWTHDSQVILVYTKGEVQDGYEDQVYTDRVQLEDPQHRSSGVFSLCLKNITVKDTGIYECFIFYSDSVAEAQFVNLTVTEQEQDTTSVWTNIEETLREYRGLGFGLTLAGIIFAIVLVFALKNPLHVNLKPFKQLHFHFCLEKPRPRKRVISCSSTNSSECSTNALIHIHRDLPIKADLAAPHRPVPEPLPPFSHPFLPSSSPTSTLTKGSSDSGLYSIDLEMENSKPGTHVSCPDVFSVL